MTTADIPTVQEALDRFRQTYPEVGSVQHIALLDEEGFVAQYATSAFDNDTRLARRVYQHASDIASRTALIWANIKDAASPYLRQTLFNTVPDDFLQQIPAYDRLFGSLDYTECDHARSIFGPAAYFVDLLRFVETHVGDSPPPMD